jgi:hypothetical protein
MPKVQLNGIEMYYGTKATSEPLLLAGFACDHTLWGLI